MSPQQNSANVWFWTSFMLVAGYRTSKAGRISGIEEIAKID
jgi:hypothetical protein